MLIILQIFGWAIILFLISLFLIFIITIRGKPIEILDTNGNSYPDGISVREKITINGSEQYVFITGENRNNPVLLFLHGGPGTPEVILESFEEGKRLEKKFVVCYWEQRGACLSYGARLAPGKMNLDIMLEDTFAITKYLSKRFNKEKIFLMGHSWGSFLGIKAIQKEPEYYKAYFGIGQVVNQKQSEILAHDYMIEHATEIGDIQAVTALEKFDSTDLNFPTSEYLMSVRSKYMNKYGIGVKHDGNMTMMNLIKTVFSFQGYGSFDVFKYILGNMRSAKELDDIFNKGNLFEESTSFSIPIYIFQGKYDYQVSYKLAKEYFELIQAPEKSFYTFKNSAHSPNYEETEKFLNIIFKLVDKSNTVI